MKCENGRRRAAENGWQLGCRAGKKRRWRGRVEVQKKPFKGDSIGMGPNGVALEGLGGCDGA